MKMRIKIMVMTNTLASSGKILEVQGKKKKKSLEKKKE